MNNSGMSQDKKIVIVLGVHRSGTSLLAAGLQALGADLGDVGDYSNVENPKGFFENRQIVDFNDRLLLFLGGRWDNPLFDGRDALGQHANEDLQPWYDEAVRIFDQNFSGKPFVAIKDPRMCQLLPFWKRVLLTVGYDESNVYFIHIARHPVEVAKSQQRRLESKPDFYVIGQHWLETVSLWMSLTYQSFRESWTDNNIFVTYEDLVEDPRRQINRIAEFLQAAATDERLDEYCQKFVDKGLKRNLHNAEESRELERSFPEAVRVYALERELSSKDSFARKDLENALQLWSGPLGGQAGFLRPVSGYLTDVVSRYLRLLADTDRFNDESNAEIAKLRRQEEQRCAESIAEIERLRRELVGAERREYESRQAVYAAEKRLSIEEQKLVAAESALVETRNSTSWRITAPVRFVGRALKWMPRVSYADWNTLLGRLRRYNSRLRETAPFLSTLLAPALKRLVGVVDRRYRDKLIRQGDVRYEEIAYTIDEYGNVVSEYQLAKVRNAHNPLVSVIVPNYNHAEYLADRLESIYGQTYKNIEVILLDDCSKDNSKDVLQRYLASYPDITRLVCNEKNSGGVFYQWEKGLAMASGELVWIAESDDWCTSNFLEELVAFFADESVMLAYAKVDFMNTDGSQRIWTIEDYLSDIPSKLWSGPFMQSAASLVKSAWAIKNIVPNVSGAVFRRPHDLAALSARGWEGMRICGDWLFYMHIIKGGVVAYTDAATNYYRIHGSNTSVSTYSVDAYYKEHEMVSTYIAGSYDVPDKVFEQQRDNIKLQWIMNRESFSDIELSRCYSIERIRNEAHDRLPNVLMVGYAFSAGGGETFPIQLANLLRGAGYSVTFLSCEQEPRESGVRNMLRSDIPVISGFHSLERIVRAFDIDIIHSHHAWVDMTILDLLREPMQCRTVISLHGMYEMMPDSDLQKILPVLVSRTAKFIYTADKNLGSFKRLGYFNSGQFVKIGNALDVYPVHRADLAELNIPDDAFVLCLVSRAIPEKGWQEGVDAVKQARALSGKDVHLILIGEGPEYDRLIREGYPEYVHLLGFKHNIRDYYAASDMGFLPSRFEGESFPLTLIDCLHAGTPFIASAIGEIPYMLDAEGDCAGATFSLVDWRIPVDDVARIIARFATDEAAYQAAKNTVAASVSKFDPAVMREKYHDIYMGVVEDINAVDSIPTELA